MKSTIVNSNQLIWIAPCGIDCQYCIAHLREKNQCPGCRVDDPRKPKTRWTCKIKTCPSFLQGEYEFCYECGEFPCDQMKHLDKRYRTRYGTSVINNLQDLQTLGIQQFLENEKKKWTCPECGETLTIHKLYCLSCGYVRFRE